MAKKKTEQKTLREVLAGFDKDEIVAIGAKIAFVYFSKAGDEYLINACFLEQYRAAKANIKVGNDSITNLVMNPPVPLHIHDEKDVSKCAMNRALSIKSVLDKIRVNTEYIDKYVDPMDRTVIDCYKSTEDDHYIIIVEGNEFGDFVSRDEFVRRYPKC